MLNTLRNALPIVAAALGRKFGVEVGIGGHEACTDGRRIQIPDIPDDPASTPDVDEADDEACEWSFGGLLGDEEPHEATDAVPALWQPRDGQPREQESFYF